MLVAVVIIFAFAGLAPLLHRLMGDRCGWVLAVGPLGVAAFFVVKLAQLDVLAPSFEVWSWAPSMGVDLAFVADGLSLAFAILVAGIGTLIVIYAMGYLHGNRRLGLFFGYLLFFMAAMLGLVLSDSLIGLFVFWELTSISSYLLIGFNHDKKSNRDAALKALFVTAAGGLVMLAGVVLLSIIGTSLGLTLEESLRISSLNQLGPEIQSHVLYPGMLICMLIGAFTKSAQVPFHFWLPAAMAGPTPVSAFLHSATMVKAGVFLLARLHPALGGTTLFICIVTAVGATTMVVGAVMATGQRDLKSILAYTTLSVLGTLVMLLGIGTDTAIKAAVAFLFAHGLYKAALFMVAGNVDHATGTRDVMQLGGLRRVLVVTAIAALIAALSKAGAPPLFGYLGKKLVFEAKLNVDNVGVILIGLAVIANICMVAVSLVIALRPFWGPWKAPGSERPDDHVVHRLPASMVIGPAVLAVLSLFVGLIPDLFDRTIGSAMASSIAGEALTMKLKLMFGLNVESLLIVGLSFGALGLGYLLYRKLHVHWQTPAWASRLGEKRGPTRGYELLYAGIFSIAAWHTRIVSIGVLRRYVTVVVLTFIAVVGPWLAIGLWQASDSGAGFLELMSPPEFSGASSVGIYEVVIILVVIVAALYATIARSRMAAVLLLGVSGLGIALIFAMYSAIDVAITQLMVETMTVILLVMVILRLPVMVGRGSLRGKVRDAVIAAMGGAVVTGLVLAAQVMEMPRTLTLFFNEVSVTKAYGRNIVNVILVDYRAMDTLGEVVVVAVAAIGVLSLLMVKPHGEASAMKTMASDIRASVILRTAVGFLSVLLVVFSVFVLLRGHNEPGGGFIGGLLLASAFAVHALCMGGEATQSLLRIRPIIVAGLGMLMSGIAGLMGLIMHGDFLSAVWFGQIPGIGKVGSVMIFDVGVYLVVFGAVTAVVLGLMDEGSEQAASSDSEISSESGGVA